MAPTLASLDHLVLTVRDIARSVAFYETLGMTPRRFTAVDGSDRTALALGAQRINLHEAGAESAPPAARQAPGRSCRSISALPTAT